jgi:hypothetical protein
MFGWFKARRIARLRKARDAAREAHREAVWRRDTRGQHAALKRLREATHALLRVEVR